MSAYGSESSRSDNAPQTAGSDLVQCIKLCEHLVGRGSPLTRPPRLPLEGAEKAEVEAIMAKALASRPELPEGGLKARAAA